MTINIGHFLTKRAFLSPELEATVEPSAGGRRQTFRQLNTRCNQVANALRTAGVASGERVGLLFEDIERMVDTARRWGLQGQLTLNNLHGFNRLFEPFVASQPRVNSLLFADERGREFLLLRMPDGEWRNRVSDPPCWGQRQKIFAWRDSLPPLTGSKWRESDYDARRCPWYQGALALALARDGDLHLDRTLSVLHHPRAGHHRLDPLARSPHRPVAGTGPGREAVRSVAFHSIGQSQCQWPGGDHDARQPPARSAAAPPLRE